MEANGLSVDVVETLIAESTQGRFLGILGESAPHCTGAGEDTSGRA